VLNHNHPEVAGAEYVVFADSSRRYLDCSEGVCRLLGYTRAEILGKTVDDISYRHMEVPKLFEEYLRSGLQNGDFVLRSKGGEPISIRYHAFVFEDGCKAAIWEPIHDWRDQYLAALMEFDPKKLVQRIEAAEQAVQAEMRRLDNDLSGSPEDYQKLRDAISGLQSLRRNSR
jgi:PAS domain S-box-containing protein